jgi:hypothetical protein
LRLAERSRKQDGRQKQNQEDNWRNALHEGSLLGCWNGGKMTEVTKVGGGL